MYVFHIEGYCTNIQLEEQIGQSEFGGGDKVHAEEWQDTQQTHKSTQKYSYSCRVAIY